MKRSTLTAAAVAAALAMALPFATVTAQDESPGPLGVTTFDVCLAISGPVVQLTPEALATGIADGTFVIEGFSSDCDDGLTAPDDDMGDDTDDASDAGGVDDSGYDY